MTKTKTETKTEPKIESGVRSMDLDLPSGLTAQVFVAGDEAAKPLVYLHSASGVNENDDFFLKLAEKFRVYAPLAPGFNKLEELDDLVSVSDVSLHYDDILIALDLTDFVLVGHSFGGMFAAELAAHVPSKVSQLVLISSVGLWNDDYPVLDIFSIPPLELGAYLWGDSNSEAAKKANSAPVLIGKEGGEPALVEYMIQAMQGLITAGKYMMPIPDKGLSRRLYRICAPTLLIWGSEDQVVPSQYAKDFGEKLRDSKELIIKGGGHMVTLECLDEVCAAIGKHGE